MVSPIQPLTPLQPEAAVTPAVSSVAEERVAALDNLFAAVQLEPWAHDFFALLRRIDALRPQQPRWGQARRPAQEALRLGQVPELNFAPAALASFEVRADLPPRLGVRFLGLLGPHGPMPLHFTEYVRERLRQHNDPTLAHFLNLFHHRVLSLFYRAWAQAQPTVHLDRPADDRYTHWLAACAGLPTTGQGVLPLSALAFHAGQLAARTRNPEALCKVLKSYFDVPVSWQSHVGQWLPIHRDDRSRLGHAPNRPERSAQPPALLGQSVSAGSKLWDRQYKFRLRLGPLSIQQYLAFVPGGSGWSALQEWVRLLAGPSQRWDLELQLKPAEKPTPRLGRHVRLGLTGWLLAPPRSAVRNQPGSEVAASASKQPGKPLPGQHPTAVASHLRLRPTTNFMIRRPGALHG